MQMTLMSIKKYAWKDLAFREESNLTLNAKHLLKPRIIFWGIYTKQGQAKQLENIKQMRKMWELIINASLRTVALRYYEAN